MPKACGWTKPSESLSPWAVTRSSTSCRLPSTVKRTRWIKRWCETTSRDANPASADLKRGPAWLQRFARFPGSHRPRASTSRFGTSSSVPTRARPGESVALVCGSSSRSRRRRSSLRWASYLDPNCPSATTLQGQPSARSLPESSRSFSIHGTTRCTCSTPMAPPSTRATPGQTSSRLGSPSAGGRLRSR